jgi:hypothetical protein
MVAIATGECANALRDGAIQFREDAISFRGVAFAVRMRAVQSGRAGARDGWARLQALETRFADGKRQKRAPPEGEALL